MWDLNTIIAQNNHAAVSAMMTAERVEVADNPTPDVWPLAYLEQRLKVGPPILSEIVNGYIDIGYMESFLNLIRDFLPEHEADILSKPRNQRAWRFCRLFDKKYFPLGVSNPEFGIHDLLYRLPVQIMGMSYAVYHDLDMRQGYMLLMSLVPYPYEGDERDIEDDAVPFDLAVTTGKKSKWQPQQSDVDWLRQLVIQLTDGGTWIAPMGFEITKDNNQHLTLRQAVNTEDVQEVIRRTVLIGKRLGIEIEVKAGRSAEEKLQSGARVVLLEQVGRIVGNDLVKRIPESGWYNKQLHLMTDRSPYAGVGEFADWALSDTGLTVLDHNYEHCEYIEGETEPLFKWTYANVEELAEQWPRVRKVRKKIDHIVEWLEGAPEERFRELLEFLLKKAEKLPPPKPRRPYEPWEHMCQLDTLAEEDDENEKEQFEREIAMDNT